MAGAGSARWRRAARGARARAGGWCNNDTVDETARMESDSVDLIVTSIPFSTQYEYSPSYRDFGHTDDDRHFFEQMDFLTPQLLRVLKPGRVPRSTSRIASSRRAQGAGLPDGGPSATDRDRHFAARLRLPRAQDDRHRRRAREQPDLSAGLDRAVQGRQRMGAGMPEYVLLFRKPPTDRSTATPTRRWSRQEVVERHGLGQSRRLQRGALAARRARLHALERQPAAGAGGPGRARGQVGLPALSQALARDGLRLRAPRRLRRAAAGEGQPAVDLHAAAAAVVASRRVDRHHAHAHAQRRAVAEEPRDASLPAAVRHRRELNPTYHRDAVNYCAAAERAAATPSLFDLNSAEATTDADGHEERAS
jgi:hypothetical protein